MTQEQLDDRAIAAAETYRKYRLVGWPVDITSRAVADLYAIPLEDVGEVVGRGVGLVNRSRD